MAFKQREAAPKRSIQNEFDTEIATLWNWRKIGDSFTYLDIQMVVTGHSIVHDFPPYHYSVRPQLSADYADNCGVIHNISFNYEEALAIINNQPIGDI